MARAKSKPKDQESIDWKDDGFIERQREVDHYPEQARQHFDSVKALQLKNEAAGYYTLHDAAIRLAQSCGKAAEWWRSRMCADWLQGRLKMRDGSAWMTIDPPARPTDPKNLSEWIAKAKFGPSGMHKLLDPHYPHPDSLDVVSAADLDEWLKPMGYGFSGALEKLAQRTTPVPAGRKPPPGDVDVWKERARARATEIIKRQAEKDLYPSQIAIADEIARSFRDERVMGAGGKPLSGAYIKRHALKGISSADLEQLSMTIRRGK